MIKKRKRQLRHDCESIKKFVANLKGLERLIEIHGDMGGEGPGRRYGLKVLNKSGVITLCACWEAFVEDLASESITFILSRAKSHSYIPGKVKASLANKLKNDKNETALWKLAGNGWKKEWESFAEEKIANFHTPNSNKIDSLFLDLVGIKKMTSCIYWPHRNTASSKKYIDDFINKRGQIAHGKGGDIPLKYVKEHRDFFLRASVKMNNRCADFINELVGLPLWIKHDFNNFTGQA